MPKTRTLLVAAAPVLLLIILSLTSRLLPLAPSENEDGGPDRRSERPGPRPTPWPVDAKTQKAIETAVSGQLTAIRKRDFKAALTFSSPDFRQMWTPEQFGSMIADGYADMLASTDWKFSKALNFGYEVHIPVELNGPNGRKYSHVYMLTSLGGKWYVVSCAPDISARERGNDNLRGPDPKMTSAPPAPPSARLEPQAPKTLGQISLP
jgi:hypothetical protein